MRVLATCIRDEQLREKNHKKLLHAKVWSDEAIAANAYALPIFHKDAGQITASTSLYTNTIALCMATW